MIKRSDHIFDIFIAYGKCVCNVWKKPITALSSKIKGLVAVDVPKLDRVGADKSSSLKHGNPAMYGTS